MNVLTTTLDGLVLLAPAVHGDARGFFVQSYLAGAHRAVGITVEFVQDNHSRSAHGTLRGRHYQRHPGQAKLVRVARGVIWDVVVDVRPGSATFGQYEASTWTTIATTSSSCRSVSPTASASCPT